MIQRTNLIVFFLLYTVCFPTLGFSRALFTLTNESENYELYAVNVQVTDGSRTFQKTTHFVVRPGVTRTIDTSSFCKEDDSVSVCNVHVLKVGPARPEMSKVVLDRIQKDPNWLATFDRGA